MQAYFDERAHFDQASAILDSNSDDASNMAANSKMVANLRSRAPKRLHCRLVFDYSLVHWKSCAFLKLAIILWSSVSLLSKSENGLSVCDSSLPLNSVALLFKIQYNPFKLL